MLFGPNLPVRTSESLSPRARDLSQQIAKTVEEFRRYYPDTTERDIQAALQVTGNTHGGNRRNIMLAAVGAVVAAVGIASAAGILDGNAPSGASPGIWIGVAGAAAAVIVVIVRVARSR
jgi:hypothetical protein